MEPARGGGGGGRQGGVGGRGGQVGERADAHAGDDAAICARIFLHHVNATIDDSPHAGNAASADPCEPAVKKARSVRYVCFTCTDYLAFKPS